MADDGPKFHPHIFSPKAASSQEFTSPRSGRSSINVPPRGRKEHGDHLIQQLRDAQSIAAARVEEQRAVGIEDGNGLYLVFESDPGFDLKFESMDVIRSGIELCTVRKTAEGRTEAMVWVPEGRLQYFLDKITAYREEDTKPAKVSGKTRPKNEDLVTSIANIRLAALQALWSDLPGLYPDPDTDAMWEVWLRHSGGIDHTARLRAIADSTVPEGGSGLKVGKEEIRFVDRTVVLVYGKGRDLTRSNDLIGAIAELRLAKTTAEFFTVMDATEQKDWVNNLLARVTAPTANTPYVCLLDTGLNSAHPLLKEVAHTDDLHTYTPAWGTSDKMGHGTPMAGLAIYGDLTDALASAQTVPLTHRLESVKMYNDQDKHEKALYGAVTSECLNRVEVKPDRKRVYCMSITASDDRDRGRPSSWSAAVDALTSGFTDGQRRLMIVSAGNTSVAERVNYPDSNMTDAVHDPAQSWNALTVGGITDKAVINQTEYPGWQVLAQAGELAPASCTSMTWRDAKKWPIKPDIVLEAGNMAKHADHAEPDYIDDSLSLLSTHPQFAIMKSLVTFGDTSASAALASRLAAMLWAKYPNLTPEAVRALMIHASTWTDAMRKHCLDGNGELDKEILVRCFGYGTPNVRQLLSSADNSLTLIAQDSISPFHKTGSEIKTREMKLHALPWPREALENLQETEVTMRVTLSYFVEPNPGDRGWSTKYGYQSHGLRFDVKRATETQQEFQERINRAVRDDEYNADSSHSETGKWFFPQNHTLSALGSVRSNLWTGKAADLAARGSIAVYPTYGWWNKRQNLKGYEKSTHYALVATISTPATDIYTPVATEINLPIVIEV